LDSSARSVETKLAAARTRLILDKPFLGALVLRLPMQPADAQWCPSTATDAKAFYYNPEYIRSLSLEQTQFMLAHEALHCALSHFARRQHRLRHRWDLACDHAVNPLLVAEGLTPPPNALVEPTYKGLTAEEIYPLIEDDDSSETLDKHAYDRDHRSRGSNSLNEKNLDRQQQQPSEAEQSEAQRGEQGRERNAQPEEGGAAGEPEPLTPDEQETLSIQWQQRLAGAAQQALQAGKLGGEMARLVDHLLQPRLPWRMLLARYMTAAARDDYSYMRPSRREGNFILPRLRSHQLHVAIAVDTSGSIADSELEEFFAEVNLLKGQMRARLILLPCDHRIAEGAPWTFEPWEEFKRPETVTGGGGTRFVPVFEWLDRHQPQTDLLVYFTDAEGEFPAREPAYPVIWLVKGRGKVPWGERVQLN